MEKLLLVMALLGSAHLAFRGLVKAGKLVFALAMPKPAHPGTVRAPDVRPMAVRKDGEEDWSKYDIPAFIRRGIPMPKLKIVESGALNAYASGVRPEQYAITVTSGLLARELITGEAQTGDRRLEARTPAGLGLVGDPDDTLGPTYASFARLLDRPPLELGAPLVEVVDREASIGIETALARYGARAGCLHGPDPDGGYTVHIYLPVIRND